MDQVKALLFDVFGTVVDWRSSVASELEALGDKSGIAPGNFTKRLFFYLTIKIIILGTTDWAKFAHDWRMGYVINTFVPLP
jgi:2-haloacid dehalogenase